MVMVKHPCCNVLSGAICATSGTQHDKRTRLRARLDARRPAPATSPSDRARACAPTSTQLWA
eukprot:13524587-Alexandrium_andersonii.AAC.1